jgi:RecB family exonuclease
MTQSQDERLGLPSASAWHRYELCAGSWQLETEARVLGQSAHETSPAAERGALIHAWLAGVVDEDGSEIKLDESERATADFLQERATEQVHRIFGDEPTLELAEKRLWDPQHRFSGRFDRVVYTPSVALVQDFKTGWREPEPAEQNSQMKVLAVLVALHMPPMLREVVVQIISGPFGVTEARYDLPALAVAYNEILSTLRLIQDPMAPLSPSPEACRFCPAALICQPCRDLLAPPTKFQTTKLPLEPDRAAKLLDEIAVLEGVFEEVTKFYYNRLLNDPTAKISGYELVPNAPRREIESVEAAKRRLSEYLDEGELNAALDLKVGQVEKLFGKKIGLKGKELREKFNEVMRGVINEKIPNPSLKRISGKPKLVQIELP